MCYISDYLYTMLLACTIVLNLYACMFMQTISVILLVSIHMNMCPDIACMI